MLRSISTENLSFFHCAIITLLYRSSNNRRIRDVLYIYLYALTFPLGVHVARRGFYVPRAISQSACSPSRASPYFFSLGMVRSRSMGLTNGNQAVGGRGEVEGEWERVAEGEEAARAEWRRGRETTSRRGRRNENARGLS